MVLYAFDCELSRAVRASKESLIPRMRLQWWRDVVEDARFGKPAKAHEVAGPLAELVCDPAFRHAHPLLDQMIVSRELELETARDLHTWKLWASQRFGALLSAASIILCPGRAVDPPRVDFAMGWAFGLRHAADMAARHTDVRLPGIEGVEIAALARGDLPDAVAARLAEGARSALAEISAARSTALRDRRLIPALLPVMWSERVLRAVRRAPRAVLGKIDDVDRPFDGLRLAWRVFRGRW